MELVKGIHVTKSKTGEIWSNILGSYDNYTNQEDISELVDLYHYCKKRYISEENKIQAVSQSRKILAARHNINIEELKINDTQSITLALSHLIAFFTEFNFEPNFRFVNTLTKFVHKNKDAAREYVFNYFSLTDSPYLKQITAKMTSSEFDEILSTLKYTTNNTIINKRFKLYYGSQGTGKTTEAIKEANGNIMICHSALLPSDLMEDFKFEDGKAKFNPSALCKAMTEGQTIVLDEINLLPFESLRFLQSLLDGKTEFIYKDHIIEIKDGFNIIGTMNLQVNGMTYALPEPLVDRASELRQYKLTAENLLSAVM